MPTHYGGLLGIKHEQSLSPLKKGSEVVWGMEKFESCIEQFAVRDALISVIIYF